MTVTIEDVVGLYCDSLSPERKAALLTDLKNPDSEIARVLEQVRDMARADIDIGLIPGLEEIAAREARLEEHFGHAS